MVVMLVHRRSERGDVFRGSTGGQREGNDQGQCKRSNHHSDSTNSFWRSLSRMPRSWLWAFCSDGRGSYSDLSRGVDHILMRSRNSFQRGAFAQNMFQQGVVIDHIYFSRMLPQTILQIRYDEI